MFALLHGGMHNGSCWQAVEDELRRHGHLTVAPNLPVDDDAAGALQWARVAGAAIGDAANAEALSAIEELSESYKGDRRWRIEHAQIVSPEDIARFGYSFDG